MTDDSITIELDKLAEEIAAIGEVLATTKPSQPAWRWFEYPAYWPTTSSQ